MNTTRTLIIGHGGREASLAKRLAQDSQVFAVMTHVNPSIARYVSETGGQYQIGSVTDSSAIAQFAIAHAIDLALVSSDEPLAAGVVDALLAAGIRTVGPTQAGSQIEWDKEYSIELMHECFPDLTPKYWLAKNLADLDAVFADITAQGIDIVVKPQGLTGGKGVKVMGAHLADYAAAQDYCQQLLSERPSESVLIVEKVQGLEFTIMILTDGVSVLAAPATYDYPYRFAGDTGPGTGGMGSFSAADLPLPFMTQADYDQCLVVAQGIVDKLREQGRHYSGVLNSGFFITANGLKFLEFNARFGDPECMNIMTVLDSSLLKLLEDIAAQKLAADSVRFTDKASVVKYLVTPEYALSAGEKRRFNVNVAGIEASGVNVFFSAAQETGEGDYISTGNSRCVALSVQADTIPQASDILETAIAQFVTGALEWRGDVGSAQYLAGLILVV